MNRMIAGRKTTTAERERGTRKSAGPEEIHLLMGGYS